MYYLVRTRYLNYGTLRESNHLLFKFSHHHHLVISKTATTRMSTYFLLISVLLPYNALIYVHKFPQLSTCVPTSDYLADSVDAFLTSITQSPLSPYKPTNIDFDSPGVPLGLTFSFPVEQTALDKGFLLTWTKGFSAKNAINKDVVKLLQDAFDRKHLHVKCVALVNDVSLLVFPHAHGRHWC